MLKFLEKQKLLVKIVAQNLAAMLLLGGVILWSMGKFTNCMYDSKNDKVKELVAAAYSQVDYYVKQAEAGVISAENAKLLAYNALKNQKYGNGDYFFISDATPKMIMHPNPNFAPDKKPEWYQSGGLSDYKDPNGVAIFKEFASIAKAKGEGFLKYSWVKAGDTANKPVPKISYVREIPAWGWIIGTGIYIDDVEAYVGTIRKQIGLVSILIFAVVVALSMLLARNINGTVVDPVKESVDSLIGGANQVASASEQISSASQELASGASEQAASLEETAASLEEMSAVVNKTADNAREARGISETARQVSGKGEASMGRLAESIKLIQVSSNEQAKIIKTIDEIAFQTNLLALNAAVEAARAGDAGKGFAVVAEEVRNLAKRSAEAARSTTDLIDTSRKNVENGVKVTEEVKALLSEINHTVSKVTTLITEVSVSSEEQAKGLEQISSAVTQIDEVTQRNSANAEESASAAEELSSQAIELQEVIIKLGAIVGKGEQVQNTRVDISEKAKHFASATEQRRAEAAERAARKAAKVASFKNERQVQNTVHSKTEPSKIKYLHASDIDVNEVELSEDTEKALV